MAIDYGTYISYRNNNSWTGEEGASKFFAEIIEQGSIGKGDKGCVFDGFYVQPKSGMTVEISTKVPGATNAQGHCMVSYDDYAFMCWQEKSFFLTLNGSSSTYKRISYIIAYVDLDIQYNEDDHIEGCPNVLKFVEVKGTNTTGTPSAPTETQIKSIVGQKNPYIILASISIGVNTSTITTSLITDLRIAPRISDTIQFSDTSQVYVAGLKQPSGKNLKISVIGPNDAYPSSTDGEQILVVQMKG